MRVTPENRPPRPSGAAYPGVELARRARWAKLLLSVAPLLVLARAARAQDPPRPNVLLICVDDLRPELGCMGGAARTPNLDALAATGRLFTRHYVQVPTCGASRRALLTGQRPRRLAQLGNDAFQQLGEHGDRPESFVELFRRAGYTTVNLGKITHEPDGLRWADAGVDGVAPPELPASWTRVVTLDWPWGRGHAGFFSYAGGGTRTRGESAAFESGDVDDRGYADGWLADAAASELAALAEVDTPFLLAVGFYKPHLPFNAPLRYWDLYDREALGLAPYRSPPAGLERALDVHSSGELLGNYGQHPAVRPLPDDHQRTLIHGYLAAASYADAQVGKVLAALDEHELRDSTVVVLWSDHGWHLGDHGVWGKHTLLERALHAPLIIRTPGLPAAGAACDALVEALDVYPTLAAIAGLELPPDLDGQSLLPWLADPELPRDRPARAWWRRGSALGRTVRTDDHRLIRWSEDGRVVQEALFDHREDPLEAASVHAARPEALASLRQTLEAHVPELER